MTGKASSSLNLKRCAAAGAAAWTLVAVFVVLLDLNQPRIHGAIWLIVLILAAAGYRKLVRQARQRDEAQAALRETNASLERRIAERTVELESAILMMRGEMADRLKTEQELEKSNDALRESERRIRSLLENMPLLGVGLNRNGEIIYCNKTLLEATGWTAEEILGRNWFGLFAADEAAVRKVFQEFLDEPETERGKRHHENNILTRQGTMLLVRWNNMALRGPEGETIGAMSMGEDITERREAEEKLRSSEERFRGIFDQASPSPCRSFAVPTASRKDSPASSRTLRRAARPRTLCGG